MIESATTVSFANTLQYGHVKTKEWIEESDVLLAIIIGVIVIFLLICCLFAYNAFYPDGIPGHLKDGEKEESEIE